MSEDKLNLKHFFITGTDTNIGKTIVSRALLQSFSQLGYSSLGFKPITILAENSLNDTSDAAILQNASSIKIGQELINPISLSASDLFSKPIKTIDFKEISSKLACISAHAKIIIIEGTGGWRVLLNRDQNLSDWVISENLPIILSVGIQSGCINQAILTAEAIKQDGLQLVGWVANRINPGLANYSEIISVLSQHLDAPLLGEIPYLIRPEQRNLSEFIKLSQLFE